MFYVLLIRCELIPTTQPLWKMLKQAYIHVIRNLLWSLELCVQGALWSHERFHLRAEFEPPLTKSSERAFFSNSMISLTISYENPEMWLLAFKAFSGLAFLKADFGGAYCMLREASRKTPANFRSLCIGFCSCKNYSSLGVILNTTYAISKLV